MLLIHGRSSSGDDLRRVASTCTATGAWSNLVQAWQICSGSPLPCPSMHGVDVHGERDEADDVTSCCQLATAAGLLKVESSITLRGYPLYRYERKGLACRFRAIKNALERIRSSQLLIVAPLSRVSARY
ncbi:hypothetical protein Dimus_008007 [Dionaea muscipula]